MAAECKNKKGSAKASLSRSFFPNGKKGVEAWWGFLAGAIVIIVVVIFLLVFFGKIKVGGESTISGIGDKLGQIFK